MYYLLYNKEIQLYLGIISGFPATEKSRVDNANDVRPTLEQAIESYAKNFIFCIYAKKIGTIVANMVHVLKSGDLAFL